MSRLLLLTVCLMSAAAYPEGAPKTGGEGKNVCINMFPTGHGANAQSSTPPYELKVDKTSLGNGRITVTLKVKDGGTTYFEGVFVQARMASCGSTVGMEAIGKFSLSANDPFLQLYNCGDNMVNNAVGQKVNPRTTSTTFYWDQPASATGHVFFRATVVKNTQTFWTNVFSEFVRDTTNTSELNTTYCEVQMTNDNAPSSVSPVTSLIVAAFVIVKMF